MATISSVELQKGSTIKRVQIDSDAYDKYLSQGYTVVTGSETNVPKTTTMTTKEQQLADIEAKIASIAERFGGIKEQIATEGITTAGGQVLVAPTIPEYKTTAPDLTEAKSLTEFYRKQIEIQQKQATEAKGAYEEYLKTSQEQQKTWWEKIMAKPTITETAEEYYEKLGIKPEEYFAERSADIAAVDVLMQEYDTAVAAKQMALVREEERLAPMEFISARMNRVEKEANIRLSQMAAGVNTKLAIMEMKSGNFEQARSLVQEAVTNYTNDLRWEYDMFVDFREQNQEIIRELDKKYQTALDKAEQYALLSWQKKEEDTTNIANLMLQYPKAGIKFGDTIQEATRKASGWSAAQVLITPVAKEAEAGWIDFTNQEKRKLAAAGINWTAPAGYKSVQTAAGYKSVPTPSGYEKALEYLYGEKPGLKIDITKDWVRGFYTPEQLKSVAKDAGFTTTVKKGWFGKEEVGDPEAYLDYLMRVVQQYRDAGFTNEQILGLIGIK